MTTGNRKSDASSGHRLVEIDALRGVAALSVVLFHMTTRYSDLFHPAVPPSLSFPGGHYGVNLFFIISGFVIFMTLERTRTSSDFVVSRFSRLFPAYWAAIALTFTLTHWLGLPGHLVSAGVVVANTVMLHGLFGVPSVDGVYWTLEVELLFYAGMLLLYRLGRLGGIHQALWGLLLLRWVYFGAVHLFGIDLSWTIYRLLILQYIPWFALGIAIYSAVHGRGPRSGWPIVTAVAAVLTLLATESLFVGALAFVLGGLVLAAAYGRSAWLRLPPLVWLGTISYPLYLLHENISWSLQLRLLALGLPTDVVVVSALGIILAMAALLSRWVERPAMRWIRASYRERRQRVVA